MGGNAVRKPVFYLIGVAVVCVIAVLVWYSTSNTHGSLAVGQGSTLHLLCVVTTSGAEGRDACCLAVLTLDDDRAAMLFLPVDLWVKGADGAMTELGAFVTTADWAWGCASIGSLLGVEIDRYVALSTEEAVAFLGFSPGVAVEVADSVRFADADGADVVVDVGHHTFSPSEALAYVEGTSTGSSSERARQIFDGLMQSVHEMPDSISRHDLRTFAAGVDANLSVEDAASAWTAMEGMAAESISSAVLPTREATHAGAARQVLQVVESERLVSSLVRGADLLTPAEISVAVFNGNGIRLSATRAADYLRARGYRVSGIANAESFGYPTSYVVVLTQEAKAWMLRGALPGAADIVTPGRFVEHYEALRSMVPAGTDVVFVVGAGMEFKE